jgi:ABC-2 type transport system permease protein
VARSGSRPAEGVDPHRVRRPRQLTYLFGGALAGSPREYLQDLLPGILVMTVSWITIYTGDGAEHGHLQGRVRSLPVAADLAAVAAGGDAAPRHRRYTMATVIMLALGLALGFRPHGGPLGVVAAVVLLLPLVSPTEP